MQPLIDYINEQRVLDVVDYVYGYVYGEGPYAHLYIDEDINGNKDGKTTPVINSKVITGIGIASAGLGYVAAKTHGVDSAELARYVITYSIPIFAAASTAYSISAHVLKRVINKTSILFNKLGEKTVGTASGIIARILGKGKDTSKIKELNEIVTNIEAIVGSLKSGKINDKDADEAVKKILKAYSDLDSDSYQELATLIRQSLYGTVEKTKQDDTPVLVDRYGKPWKKNTQDK